MLPPLLRHRSGIRRYTAFCQQFGLTPLPLNLCCFVSYLHQQQLSPASVRLYLAALCYLQIVAVGHDPQPGEFPRLQYAVQRLTPSRSRPLRLPITPAILRSLHRWSPPPVSYWSRLMWAACCLGFFAFLRSGEFTCPSSAAYNSSMLSWGDIQVDSRNHPSYLRMVLRHSKTSFWGWGVCLWVPQVTPCAQSQQCCLTYRFGLAGQVPCSCISMVAHCHRLIWWQQFVKPWLQTAWMCHVSMAIVFGLELLLPQPRLASQTPSFSPWVAGSRLHS